MGVTPAGLQYIALSVYWKVVVFFVMLNPRMRREYYEWNHKAQRRYLDSYSASEWLHRKWYREIYLYEKQDEDRIPIKQ